MRGLISYVSWEIIAIHVLTGLLFAAVNALIVRALVPGHVLVAIGLAPLLVWSWWGFWAEARYVLRASRDLRRSAR